MPDVSSQCNFIPTQVHPSTGSSQCLFTPIHFHPNTVSSQLKHCTLSQILFHPNWNTVVETRGLLHFMVLLKLLLQLITLNWFLLLWSMMTVWIVPATVNVCQIPKSPYVWKKLGDEAVDWNKHLLSKMDTTIHLLLSLYCQKGPNWHSSLMSLPNIPFTYKVWVWITH